MNNRAQRFLCVLCFLGSLCLSASADELKLKDGTKITGRIVGYEGDHFKVETPYGFALVQRDKVASITMSEDKKGNGAKPAASQKSAPPAQAPSAPSVSSTPSPSSAPAASITPAPAPPAAPPPEPAMREEVTGNVYTNHTYGFRLYKPPSWQVIEGAQKSLPNTVVAMGTRDESTLLVVGREALRGTLDTQAAVTERRLREIYQNYRATEDERTIVGGQPALSRRFHGLIDGRDWSGRVIWVARGSELYTIFGMTYAESDLIQIQENVISKTISSLEFLRP